MPIQYIYNLVFLESRCMLSGGHVNESMLDPNQVSWNQLQL
jgi:hypothetical protein